MTKEELKKEAFEYAFNKTQKLHSSSERDFVYGIYLEITEPKEKRIEELEKEITKLKGDADSVFDNRCKGDDPCPHLKKKDEQLTKAREIIRKFLNAKSIEETCVVESEAEQFLGKVEK